MVGHVGIGRGGLVQLSLEKTGGVVDLEEQLWSTEQLRDMLIGRNVETSEGGFRKTREVGGGGKEKSSSAVAFKFIVLYRESVRQAAFVGPENLNLSFSITVYF